MEDVSSGVSSAGGSCGKTKKSTIDRRSQPLVPNRNCYWRAKGAPLRRSRHLSLPNNLSNGKADPSPKNMCIVVFVQCQLFGPGECKVFFPMIHLTSHHELEDIF
jgi:hypothetical protein